MADYAEAIARDVGRIANEMSALRGAELAGEELAVLTEAVTAIHAERGLA